MAPPAIQSRYNVFRYNDGRYNGGPLSTTFSTDLVVFESFSLHDNSKHFVHALQDSGPSRDVLGGAVPRGDGEFLNADYWRRKYIELHGTVVDTSATLLEARMDTIRKNLRKPEGTLDITRNSVVRRYTATLVNMESLFPRREHYHTTWIPFTARFECRTPFATDRAYTTREETISSSPTNVTGIDNTGTIEAEPVIFCIFDAANTVTVVNVKRIDGDGTTLDEIEYSGTAVAGDVLEFDSELKRVRKNGAEVNYTGAFPVADVGGNIFKFTVTATSFTMRVTVKHKNRYL